MRRLVDEIEEIASSLSAINPTENPLLGWKGYGGVPSYDAPLDGFWKLRFTTAADATFRPGKRGPAFTYQIANATAGFLLNCVEFRTPKVLRSCWNDSAREFIGYSGKSFEPI